jgi:hypothetical protein
MTHSPCTVKLYLPEVKVLVNGEIVTGQVTGTMEDWSTVIVNGVNYEFRWQTIANSLNSGKPLRIE